jgi:hypothetical protein
VTNVDEGCIKARHQFPNFTDQDITYGKIVVGLLVVKFDKFAAFEQRDFDSRRACVDDQFFFHGVRDVV